MITGQFGAVGPANGSPKGQVLSEDLEKYEASFLPCMKYKVNFLLLLGVNNIAN